MRDIVSPLSGIRSPFGPIIDPHKVAGQRPPFVADFGADEYRASGAGGAFSDALTFARAGNATMVDSDGLLKWAPHNLLKYSEDFTVSAWTKADTTVTANAAVAPDGTTTADEISHTSTTAELNQYVNNILTNGEKYTVSVYAKYVDHQWFRIYHENGSTYFDLVNGVTGTVSANSASITDVGNGWYLCEVNNTHRLTDSSVLTVFLLADGNGSGTETSGTSAYIWGAHLYRSDDLGGMVNNPDRGDSYVPTTSAAKYLPRRGHHVYNGTSWVNEGLLLESEARTNVLEYSAELDNGYWQKAGSRTEVIANQITAPDGTLTADLVQAITGSTTGEQYVRRSFSGLSGTYTMSAFVKKANWRYITIRAGGGIAVFDIDTATFTNLSGNVASVQDFGDGWYRISVSQTVVGTTDFPTIGIADGPTSVLWATAPTSNEGVYVWGVQYEVGPTPSSYIPTAGSTATRAAETLTVPAANLPWPNPQVIGDELVTNGTFDSDISGWTDASSAGGSISWNALGYLDLVNSTGTSRAGEDISVTSGKVYQISVDIVSLGGSTSAGLYLDNTVSINFSDTGVGTHTIYYVTPDATLNISLRNFSAGTTVSIDNISVREINPLAVSIQMDGLETFADEGSATQETLFDWRVDSNNRITLDLDTDSTKVGTLTLTMVNGSGTDETISTTAELTPGVNDPFNVAIVCTSNEIGIALDGTAETRVSHSIGLPDLSAEDATLGGNGTRAQLRAWAVDLTNAGQESATS